MLRAMRVAETGRRPQGPHPARHRRVRPPISLGVGTRAESRGMIRPGAACVPERGPHRPPPPQGPCGPSWAGGLSPGGCRGPAAPWRRAPVSRKTDLDRLDERLRHVPLPLKWGGLPVVSEWLSISTINDPDMRPVDHGPVARKVRTCLTTGPHAGCFTRRTDLQRNRIQPNMPKSRECLESRFSQCSGYEVVRVGTTCNTRDSSTATEVAWLPR